MSLFSDPLVGDAYTPLDPRLAQNQATLENKWASIAPILQGFGSTIPVALRAMDEDRVARGAAPLPAATTIRAATAAARGQLQTPQPERRIRDLPGNTLRDLRNIVGGIFKLPAALAEEARALPTTGQAIAQGEGNIIQRVAAAPGFRMLPGAYTVGNVAGGPEGLREAATHPLMTLLDVLPGVKKAAAGTQTARAVAQRAGAEAGQVSSLLGEAPGVQAARAQIAAERVNPIRAVATNRIGEAGLERNALGELVDAAGTTRAGTMARSTFGRAARDDVARPAAMATQALRHGLQNTDGPIPKVFRDAGMEPVVQAGREALKLTKDFEAQYGPEWVVEATQKAQIGDWSAMTPEQRAYGYKMREVRQPLENWKLVNDESTVAIDGEIFHVNEAKNLLARRRTARRLGELADIYEAMPVGAHNLDDYLDSALDVARRPTAPSPKGGTGRRSAAELAAEEERGLMSAQAKRARMEGWLLSAGADGFDVAPLLKTLRSMKATNLDDAARAIEEFRASAPQARTVATPAQMAETLLPYVKANTWPKASLLYDQIQGERWAEARKTVRELSRNKRAAIPGIDQWVSDLDMLHRRQLWTNRNLPVRARKDPRAFAERAGGAAETALDQTVPARFGPLIAGRARDSVAQLLDTPEAQQRVIGAIARGKLEGLPGWDAAKIDEAIAGASQTWRELRAEGFDPVFVHRVNPSRVSELEAPRLSEVPRTPTQTKERALDISPHIQDGFAAVSHEALEWMNRRVSEDFILELRTRRGRTRAEVEAELMPKAEQLLARTDARLGDIRSALDQVVAKEYTAFNPEQHGYNWASPRLSKLNAEEWMLPRYLADNLQRMHNPRVDRIGAIFDPVMNLFRTMVIPLSPKTQVNNVVGGGILAMAQHGPEVFTKWGEARRMMREGVLPEEMRLTHGTARWAFAEMNHASGRTGARLFDESMRARGFERVADARGTAGRWVNAATDKMFDLNEFFDDQYRAMSYLQQSQKALSKGRTAEYAHLTGLEAARNVLQQWSDLTPIERTTIRSVAPFYSFASFSVRNALRLAGDHPLRLAILGSFARAELEDLDGLPERFLSVMFFGKPDAGGNQKAINIGALNPFAALPDSFTTLGFISSFNPVLQTLAEQAGIKDGQREAYPNLRYDPESGSMVATAPGLLQSFVGNVIPQTQSLAALAGLNSDFRARAQRDPEGAMRSFFGSLGVPFVASYRTYNVPQERAKHEINVADDARRALNDSLRTGQQGYASQFPTNRVLLEQIRQLQADGSAAAMQKITDLLAPPNQQNTTGARIVAGGI